MLGKLLENPGAASYLHQFYCSNRLSQTVSHANRHQYYTTDELMKDSWPLMGFNYLSTIPVNYMINGFIHHANSGTTPKFDQPHGKSHNLI